MHRRKGGVLSYRNLEVRSSWPKVCTCVEAVAFPFFDLLSPTVNRHNVETGPTRVALVCTPCAVTRRPIAAVAWKPDEVENFGRAATAPTRNAVEIPLLRRRGATHLSAQRRRRRCDTPWENSFAVALLCSRGAWRCGSRGVCHERRIVRDASRAFAACSCRSVRAKLSSLDRAL